MQIDECTAVTSPCARRQAISSMTITSERKSPPPPPYSAGIAGPRKPSSPRRRQVARSVARLRFRSATLGSISRSAKRRNWARNIACWSVKVSRRIGARPPVRRVAPVVARPGAHRVAPVDEPGDAGPIELDARAPRDLDEGEPREIRPRGLAADDEPPTPCCGPRLEPLDLGADIGTCGLERRGVAPLGRREERLAGDGAERLGQVEEALELLDPDDGPRGDVGGHEGRLGVALLEVLDDRARLVERQPGVGERRDLAVRAAGEVLGTLLLALAEAQQHGLVGEPLLLEHQLHAPREGRAGTIVEADHPISPPRARRARRRRGP